jgi:2-polyprenyl-3-methyl-5-hydroxy-6-metoxy-1,4-benzoquinol methylase
MFRPLAEKGVRVLHADMKEGVGIDVVGSVLDASTQAKLSRLGIRSVLCNNVLEHVVDIDAMCRALACVCPVGGLLLISVPHGYPFHPDPIDNGFRPGVPELAQKLAPYGFELRTGELVSFGSYGRALAQKRWLIARDLYLLLAGLFDRTKWRVLVSNYRFLIRQYDVACAVFVRR